MFNPGRYKGQEPVCLSPQKIQGRSQCVSFWKVQGRSQFVSPQKIKEGASLSFTPGCGGWGWPAIEDGWVGQQWEHSTCLGVTGV